MSASSTIARTVIAVAAALTVTAQVGVILATVGASAARFPEVAPYSALAVVWACAIVACVQVALAIGWHLTGLAARGRTVAEATGATRALIGVGLVLGALCVAAAGALDGLGFATPGLMLLLFAGAIVGLGGAAALGAYVANHRREWVSN